MDMWFIIWLVVAAVMIIAEMMSLGLTSIWFAGGAVVSAVMAYFGAHWTLQLVGFAIVSLVLLVFTRPLLAKRIMKEPERTNVEGLIGEQAIVKEQINNLEAKGVVMVNGLEWTARSTDNSVIEKDSVVEIVEVRGVKLMVKNV